MKKYPCILTKSPQGQTVCKTNAQGQIVVDPNAFRPQYGSYTPDYADTIIPRCVKSEKLGYHVCEERIMKNQWCNLWEHDGKLYDRTPYRMVVDPITPGWYGKCDRQTQCKLDGKLNKWGPMVVGFHTAKCRE
jgi:hypothetical protein